MVSFKSSRKISSYLVRAKLSEIDTFTSTAAGKIYKVSHKRNCDNKPLLNLLTCNHCKKHYSRETTDSFRRRWNNYKYNDRKFTRNETCIQEHLFRHFNCEDHIGFLENVSITLIGKTDGGDSKKEKIIGGESLKLMHPLG